MAIDACCVFTDPSPEGLSRGRDRTNEARGIKRIDWSARQPANACDLPVARFDF